MSEAVVLIVINMSLCLDLTTAAVPSIIVLMKTATVTPQQAHSAAATTAAAMIAATAEGVPLQEIHGMAIVILSHMTFQSSPIALPHAMSTTAAAGEDLQPTPLLGAKTKSFRVQQQQQRQGNIIAATTRANTSAIHIFIILTESAAVCAATISRRHLSTAAAGRHRLHLPTLPASRSV